MRCRAPHGFARSDRRCRSCGFGSSGPARMPGDGQPVTANVDIASDRRNAYRRAAGQRRGQRERSGGKCRHASSSPARSETCSVTDRGSPGVTRSLICRDPERGPEGVGTLRRSAGCPGVQGPFPSAGLDEQLRYCDAAKMDQARAAKKFGGAGSPPRRRDFFSTRLGFRLPNPGLPAGRRRRRPCPRPARRRLHGLLRRPT